MELCLSCTDLSMCAGINQALGDHYFVFLNFYVFFILHLVQMPQLSFGLLLFCVFNLFMFFILHLVQIPHTKVTTLHGIWRAE